MIRVATPKDAVALDAFLRPYAPTSMFLRGNLAAYGIGASDQPNATMFYLAEEAGQITAVVGATDSGFLMCQAPHADRAFWQACAAALDGRKLVGMTGVPEQIDALVGALGLDDAAFRVRRLEPLYRLALADLPEVRAQHMFLRRPKPQEAAWLAPWFDGYHAETGLGTLGGVDGSVAADRFVEKPDSRLLAVGDQVSAMSALNARTEDAVQVGGVYVPPAKRGKGFGGLVVALHLAEARAEGVTEAILFAVSSFAARAYEAIGFRHIGSYQVALLAGPVVIGAGR